MKRQPVSPPVTICVLAYGDYPHLVRRCLKSIQTCCDRRLYHLVVGANVVSPATADYLKKLRAAGRIDRLISSSINLNKCPMMRRMFAQIDTEFIWWFDDDSYLTRRGILSSLLKLARNSPPTTVMWGQECVCTHPSTFTDLSDTASFVRSAPWYSGLTPPAWEPGGQGEFNFQGQGTGDGRWRFIAGGCWLVRTRVVRALDWPDRRLVKLGDDVFLGEALRQQGWHFRNTGSAGLVINGSPRRGDPGASRRVD